MWSVNTPPLHHKMPTVTRSHTLPHSGTLHSSVKQTTHGAVQFAVYDELKYLASRLGRGPEEGERQLGSGELSLFAAASKLTASVTTYPSQVGAGPLGCGARVCGARSTCVRQGWGNGATGGQAAYGTW